MDEYLQRKQEARRNRARAATEAGSEVVEPRRYAAPPGATATKEAALNDWLSPTSTCASLHAHELSAWASPPPLLPARHAGGSSSEEAHTADDFHADDLGASQAQLVRQSAEAQRREERAAQEAAIVAAGRRAWEENQAAIELNRRRVQQHEQTPRHQPPPPQQPQPQRCL